MANRILAIMFLTIIILATGFTSAVCTVSLDESNYHPTETATATIACSGNEEKTVSYTLNWTYANGTILETDNGTIPDKRSEAVFQTFFIPTGTAGIINATLTGTNLEGTASANVSGAVTGSLIIRNPETSSSPLLIGKRIGLRFEVIDENNKTINGAQCNTWTEDGNLFPIESSMKEIITYGGFGTHTQELSNKNFEEDKEYLLNIQCICGASGSGKTCTDEDGVEVTSSSGGIGVPLLIAQWLEVSTLVDKSQYEMKDEIFICANISNTESGVRIPLEIFHEVRCSAGTDNDEDLDRTLIIENSESPDERGIGINSTQMQCKKFTIPEQNHLQGKSSECYASTTTWVIGKSGERIINYATTSSSFNITSDELNIPADWQLTSATTLSSIVNLSESKYDRYSGTGTGNVDIKLICDECGTNTNIVDSIELFNSISSITISNRTANLTEHIDFELEFLEDGYTEIEIKNVPLDESTGNTWWNITIEFYNNELLQTIALQGIENKTGTFHLDVDCPSYATTGEDMSCIITAYVEDSQTVEKEVDFTCEISDGTSTYSSLNFNQMITKTPLLITRTFAVPSTLENGQQHVLQCYADYYNLGSRRDSFFDSFITGTTGTTSEGGSTGIQKILRGVISEPPEEEEDSTTEEGENLGERVSITGGVIGAIEKIPLFLKGKGIYVFVAIILIITTLLFIFSDREKKTHLPKSKQQRQTFFKKIIGTSLFMLALLFTTLGIYAIGGNLINAYQTSQESIIQDPLFRTIILSTFILISIIILFKVLNIRAQITIGHTSPVEKYWKHKN